MNELTLKINMDNLAQSERDALMKLVKKANKVQDKPKYRDAYWFVSSFGYIDSNIWVNDNADKWQYLTGNCFKTEGEAILHFEKIKVESELRRYAEEHNKCAIDWYDEGIKYYLFVNHDKDDLLEIGYTNFEKRINEVFFTSRKIALDAIQEIGEDRIKKYLFGVS